jgi:phage terminase large subunit-like protein
MKDHPRFGWRPAFEQKILKAIHFNTGVTLYFKTYAQNPQSLQSGTVSYIGCDEELPFTLYDELKFRLSHTSGYFSMVFTATLNQEEWRCAMEEAGTRVEKFVDATKMQISLYDCKEYEDGTPTTWTDERIDRRKADCGTEAEVQRRIYGKFVRSKNIKYVFNTEKNTMEPRTIPRDWYIYSGVDIGAGGRENHPAAIIFVGVAPDFSRGEVFLGWRGDGVQTTNGDILTKYLELREPFDSRVVEQRYDYHAKDFFLIASRIGETFLMANKKHDEGEDILNTLFKHGALVIHETDELMKLTTELRNLMNDVDKRKAVDDFVDALRYCVVGIPWNMEKIKKDRPIVVRKQQTEIDLRRSEMIDDDNEFEDSVIEEVEYWNKMYENQES